MDKKYIICSIDSTDLSYAYELSIALKGKIAAVKLGLEFFTARGIDGVNKIIKAGIPVFLDLKLHDIPNTVAKTASALKHLPIFMLTVHVSGGADMMHAISQELSNTKIKVIGVTVLTSLSNQDMRELNINDTTSNHALHLAHAAKKHGLDGVVCSGHEVADIKKTCDQDFITVTPGIRLQSCDDDQKRVVTPEQAVKLGADYLVIGRPITSSAEPIKTVNQINTQLTTL